MTNSTVFSNYVSKNFKTDLNKAVTALNKASSMIQDLLYVITNQIESDFNASRLTDLIVALSETSGKGKVLVGTHAKQVYQYMSAMVPGLSWDKDSQTVKVSSRTIKEHDFNKTMEAMKAVQWDQWGKQKADDVFNDVAEFQKALAALTKIIDPARCADPRLVKEASKLLSNAKSGKDIITQIKAERKAKAA